MAQHIIVTDYNPLWQEQFAEEAKLIKKILGENCIAVHHIGSTAVPGLVAKPIIDIMPVVKNIDLVDTVAYDFEKTGYEYLGEFGIPGRRYLRKGGDERTHQIHIFAETSIWDIQRHLAVRDYLRSHEKVRREYGKLKNVLAQKYPFDIDGYCNGKDEFIKQIEKDAMIWKMREDLL